MDGSVYRFHPTFHNLMVQRIRQFVQPGITFDVVLAEDGSGIGVNISLSTNPLLLLTYNDCRLGGVSGCCCCLSMKSFNFKIFLISSRPE